LWSAAFQRLPDEAEGVATRENRQRRDGVEYWSDGVLEFAGMLSNSRDGFKRIGLAGQGFLAHLQRSAPLVPTTPIVLFRGYSCFSYLCVLG
jgi:hypothetical protein